MKSAARYVKNLTSAPIKSQPGRACLVEPQREIQVKRVNGCSSKVEWDTAGSLTPQIRRNFQQHEKMEKMENIIYIVCRIG